MGVMTGWRHFGLCALVAGCATESETTFSAFDHVAVGSTIGGYMSFDRCEGGGGGHCDLPTCEEIRVPITSARVDDPGVFSVVVEAGEVAYTAVAPGTTTLRVTGDDGTVIERRLTAAVPDRVEAQLACAHYGVPTTTTRYGTDTEVVVTYKLSGGGAQLAHDATLRPLESTALIRQEDDFSMVRARFATPPTGGPATITSRFDPMVALQVDVFAAGDVTAIEQAPYNLRAGQTANLPTLDLVVGTARACTDTFARTIRVLTPATCSAPETTVVGPESYKLDGIAEGDCMIEVTLDGTSLTRSVTYPVLPPA